MDFMIAFYPPIFNPALWEEKKPEKNCLPIMVCKLILKPEASFLLF